MFDHYRKCIDPPHTAALCPGLPGWRLPGWAGTRKVKPVWISLKQETVSGSGFGWAICKSAPCSRQITMPAPYRLVFYRPDALHATQPTVSKHWRQRNCTYIFGIINSFTIHFFVFWTHYIEIVQRSFLVRHAQEYILLEVFQAFGSPGHFCRYLQSIVKVHTLCTTLEAVLTILDMPNAEEVWDKPGNLLGRSHVPMNVLHGPAVFDRRNWGLRWPPSSAIIVVYPRNSLGLCDISVRMKEVV